MSIFVRKKEHSVLARCVNCHHGTEKGMPCRWCSKPRRVDTFLCDHDEKLRVIAQNRFNTRIQQGII